MLYGGFSVWLFGVGFDIAYSNKVVSKVKLLDDLSGLLWAIGFNAWGFDGWGYCGCVFHGVFSTGVGGVGVDFSRTLMPQMATIEDRGLSRFNRLSRGWFREAFRGSPEGRAGRSRGSSEEGRSWRWFRSWVRGPSGGRVRGERGSRGRLWAPSEVRVKVPRDRLRGVSGGVSRGGSRGSGGIGTKLKEERSALD